jgi:hypothetical protein
MLMSNGIFSLIDCDRRGNLIIIGINGVLHPGLEALLGGDGDDGDGVGDDGDGVGDDGDGVGEDGDGFGEDGNGDDDDDDDDDDEEMVVRTAGSITTVVLIGLKTESIYRIEIDFISKQILNYAHIPISFN